MHLSAFRRGLAAFLCAQPVFWASTPALAQTLEALPDTRDEQSGATGRQPFDVQSPDVPMGQDGMQSPFRSRSTGTRQPASGVPASPELPVAIDEPVDPDTYVLGHGDVLELNFWGVQNFTLRVPVDLEGRAFVPKVGYFALLGKTLTDARRTMRESVARYYPRLSFGVGLAAPRTFLVQVVDDVLNPGSYRARATDRVAAVILKAGGFGAHASRRRIELRRRDGTEVRVDLLLYAMTGDVRHNPRLLDGDVVRVPFEQVSAAIDGAVNRPGRYELVKSGDLAELVDLAGGLAPAATTLLPVRLVRRAQDDRRRQQDVDFASGGKLPALPLQNDDLVTIPSAVELQRLITVIGAIAGATTARDEPRPQVAGAVSSATTVAITPEEASATRRVPFVEGDTVRTVLDRVGGVGPLADLAGAYLLRNGQTIGVDLQSLLMLRDLRADRRVELGDTLVVPFKRRNILVEGAVAAPGAYPFNPNYGIDQYLSLAGGRNRFARSVTDVRVVTPNGEMKDYVPGLKIEPGSSVVVPERNFSRSEIVQIILGAAGIIVSGVAVVIAATR